MPTNAATGSIVETTVLRACCFEPSTAHQRKGLRSARALGAVHKSAPADERVVLTPGLSYFSWASRSASSSQVLIARRTFSLAGIPLGKSACRSASRSTDPPSRVRERSELLTARLRRRRGVVVVVAGVVEFAADVVRPARRRLERVRVVAPATPCAWRAVSAKRGRARERSSALWAFEIFRRVRLCPCTGHWLPPSQVCNAASIRA